MESLSFCKSNGIVQGEPSQISNIASMHVVDSVFEFQTTQSTSSH